MKIKCEEKEEFKRLIHLEKVLCEELGRIISKQKNKNNPTEKDITKLRKTTKYLQSLKESRLKIAEKFRPKFAAIVDELKLNLGDESIIKKVLESDQQMLKVGLVKILPIEYKKMITHLSEVKTKMINEMKPIWQFFNSDIETSDSEIVRVFSEKKVEDLKKLHESLMERKEIFNKEMSSIKNGIHFFQFVCFKKETFPLFKSPTDLCKYRKEMEDLKSLYLSHEQMFLF